MGCVLANWFLPQGSEASEVSEASRRRPPLPPEEGAVHSAVPQHFPHEESASERSSTNLKERLQRRSYLDTVDQLLSWL